MTIKKTENGKWVVDIQPGGRSGRRIQKTFATKTEANAWLVHIKAETTQNPDWMPASADKRTLQDLANEWYDAHGMHLKDGEARKRLIDYMITDLKNPKASEFQAVDFTEYRQRRIKGTTTTDKVSANTTNHELAYLKAIFNYLIKTGSWRSKNPVDNVKPIKIDENPLSFLSSGQIEILLAELDNARNPDVKMIAEICLRTGARWTEAESLKPFHVVDNRITYSKTKTRKARTIPIDAEFGMQISARLAAAGKFESSMSAFAHGIKRCGIELPNGQMTHVLRHTFASHFIINGGNILVLQKILGHTDIKTTMRYAHLQPGHLKDALTLNPLFKDRQ